MQFLLYILFAVAAVNAVWFTVHYRRNKRDAQMHAALKRYANSIREEWTEADGR